MEKTYPLGVVCDRTKDRSRAPLQITHRASKRFRQSSESAMHDQPDAALRKHVSRATSTLHVRVAGFGGQGVLLLGEVLAEAGLDAGLEVSWLPSYGPEMRSGTSNCHVRVSERTH